MTSKARNEDGSVSLVTAALALPLLALSLGIVLHLGVYLLSRQVAITAVQQGLTAATANDGTTSNGEAIARDLIADHSAAELMSLTTAPAPTTLTMTARIRTPALVPGLTRTVTVTQTATREAWIRP